MLRQARWLNHESLRWYGISFALISSLLLANSVIFDTGSELGGDFINFFAGVKAAAGGSASSVYNRAWFHAFVATTLHNGTFRTYDYPPPMLVLTFPLALFPFGQALVAWLLLGGALCFVLLRRLVGWEAAALTLIGAPAACLNLFFCQNGYFTAGALAGGLIILERRPVLAGVCFGCLICKPQLAILLPIALAADRRWGAFVATGITATAFAVVASTFFGVETWSAFFKHVLEFDTGRGPARLTILAAARSFGAAPALADALQLASGTLALSAVAIIWRSPAPAEIKYAALAVASFLATPFALPYDEISLIFAAAWLGREGMRIGFLPWERMIVVALLTLPLPMVAIGLVVGIPVTPVALFLILLALLRRALANPVPISPVPAQYLP